MLKAHYIIAALRDQYGSEMKFVDGVSRSPAYMGPEPAAMTALQDASVLHLAQKRQAVLLAGDDLLRCDWWKTLAAGAREAREFLDWTLSKALKHCTTIHIYKNGTCTEALRSIPEIHRNLAECLESLHLSLSHN